MVHNELLASCLNTCSVELRSIVLVESVLCHKHLMLCGGSALSEEFYIGCECQKARSHV